MFQHLTMKFVTFSFLICLVGCRDSVETKAVVTPPESSLSQTADQAQSQAIETQPPGELEMPEGDIPITPPVGADDSRAKSGGLEMPANVLPDKSDSSLSSNNSSASTSKTANLVDVSIEPWESIAKKAKSTGRITVVDLWSLACEPCLKEFPGLVELNQSMKNQIQCMSVDVDFDGRKSRPPEHYKESVTEFLVEKKATFPNFICQTASDDLFRLLELDSIPAVLIYDAQGKLIKRFVDAGETIGFTYKDDVVPFLKTVSN